LIVAGLFAQAKNPEEIQKELAKRKEE